MDSRKKIHKKQKKITLFLDDNEKIYHFCKLVWTFVLEIL